MGWYPDDGYEVLIFARAEFAHDEAAIVLTLYDEDQTASLPFRLRSDCGGKGAMSLQYLN